MTEASLKRDREDDKTDGAAGDVQAVIVEAVPEAALEEDDMVGPMLPPQAKKRKVCSAAKQQNTPFTWNYTVFAALAGSGA